MKKCRLEFDILLDSPSTIPFLFFAPPLPFLFLYSLGSPPFSIYSLLFPQLVSVRRVS